MASVGPDDNEINQGRRRFASAAFAAFMTAWFIAFFRFFASHTFRTSHLVRNPTCADFGLGVDTKISAEISHIDEAAHARTGFS